jgi:isopentenyl phosphate kinase
LRSKPIVLKFGGSVVTYKEKVLSPNYEAIKRLAEEVARAEAQPLIIVHGGGSFGHPLASVYRIAEGFSDSRQILGFSKTHEAMVFLNNLIVRNLLDQDVPAFSMAPSSFIITSKGRIQTYNYKPLIKAVDMHLVPVLHGDAVLDFDKGFAVLSGDQIVAHIALKLKAEKIIMGIDVDGLYDSDPKLNPSAHFIPNIKLEQLEKLKNTLTRTSLIDVTHGMMGKISEIILAIRCGIPTLIVNASKPGNIEMALKGEEVVGTKIER